MSGDLLLEAAQKSEDLDRLVAELRQDGYRFAEARRRYQIALAKITLDLRGQYPAILVNSLALGTDAVADLRFQKDNAEAIYKATAEAINVTKLQLRLINEQYNREWAQAGSATGRM